jgi:hypothetical protein
VLLNDVYGIEIADNRMIGRLMNDDLENIWKESVVSYMKHYPGFRLEGLKKTIKPLSQDG